LTKHTKKLNYKIIIAFDEYEAFHKHIVKKHGEDILESMRSFIQSQNQVIFLFAGMLRLSDLTTPNWDEYFQNASQLYENLSICRYIMRWVEEDDLVWTRDPDGEYYLAKVVSG